MGYHYPEVIYLLKTYSPPGVDDKRAVQTFIDCETDERVRAVKGQLYAISRGRYDDATFDKVIGVDKRMKHGSYEEWAKLMLQWMAGYKG